VQWFVLKTCLNFRKLVSVRNWRYFQNLMQLFNKCNAEVVFPDLSIGWSVIAVTAAYCSTLKLYGIIDMAMYIYMVSIAFEAFVFLNAMFTQAGKVFETSKSLILR